MRSVSSRSGRERHVQGRLRAAPAAGGDGSSMVLGAARSVCCLPLGTWWDCALGSTLGIRA